MKRFLLLSTIVVLAFGSAGATEKAEDLAVSAGEPETCEYKTAEEIMQDWLAQHREPVSVPDCPAENNNCSSNNLCGGSNPCGISGNSSSVDTGLTKCRTTGGSMLNCSAGGNTVHVTTWPCSQCACCSAPIPCICPPCSQVVRLTCGEYGGTGSP